MAAKAEVLIGTARRSKSASKAQGFFRSTATAVVEWGRRGELGSSQNTDLGRWTGGRC